MEDTLRAWLCCTRRWYLQVLILVLMEDTLRAALKAAKAAFEGSLNPCFNGRYSQRYPSLKTIWKEKLCLNPCFNGRYSQRL